MVNNIISLYLNKYTPPLINKIIFAGLMNLFPGFGHVTTTIALRRRRNFGGALKEKIYGRFRIFLLELSKRFIGFKCVHCDEYGISYFDGKLALFGQRSTNQFSVRRNSIWALSVSRRPKGSDLHWHGWMAAEGWGSWRRRRRCKWVRITGENTFHLDQRPTPFVRCRSWWYKYYFGVNKHIPSHSPKKR